MIKIQVVAISDDAHMRDKIGRFFQTVLREQMSATPWELTVHYRQPQAFQDDGVSKFINEGRAR